MKFVALVSGGKDSIYSIQVATQRYGHELVACVHLAKPAADDEESFLYQSAASEAVHLQITECLGVPLISVTRTGKSCQTGLVYEHHPAKSGNNGDEVEDLYRALQQAKEQYPCIQAVSSGAILSTYQRVRIEHVCNRLGLQPLAYLWRMQPQSALLEEMLNTTTTTTTNMDICIVKTAAPPGLVPRKHVGKSLRALQPLLERLHAKYQLHVCGEGGEYETLVLDCALFRKRLVLESTSIVADDEADEDIAGSLVIHKCCAVEKTEEEIDEEHRSLVVRQQEPTDSTADSTNKTETVPTPVTIDIATTTQQQQQQLHQTLILCPHVRCTAGGLWSTSAIWSTDPSSSSITDEACNIFTTLRHLLQRHHCTAQDVCYVHLYLTDMSNFALINTTYRDFFGVVLPPSRSTIAVSHLNGSNVMLDCMVQAGSGEYMRSNTTSNNPYTMAALQHSSAALRRVLHVQSISEWAPVCVGPYSQTNTIRDCVHFVSGQIGLDPGTMQFVPPRLSGWREQLEQSFKNLARVLDALDGSCLEQLVSGIVFVSDSVVEDCDSATVAKEVNRICTEQLVANGGVVAGYIETGLTRGNNSNDEHDVYEDEETAAQDRGATEEAAISKGRICPLLLVSIPQMPVGALVEVETIVATRKAYDCLQLIDDDAEFRPSGAIKSEPQFDWDTGHDFGEATSVDTANAVEYQASFRSLGTEGFKSGVVVASLTGSSVVSLPGMLCNMLDLLLAKTTDWLHLRLYYNTHLLLDGHSVHLAFQSAVSRRMDEFTEPAITVVPVGMMRLLQGENNVQETAGFSQNSALAVQGLSLDAVRLQDELWIRYQRS